MSGSPPDRVEIWTPAKLNLGLEVIGRRSDGYHDIATIFLAIDVKDHLCLSPQVNLSLSCNDSAIAGQGNLVLRALRMLRAETVIQAGAHVYLRKAIPAVAGLGGASSDAAAALIAARELWRLPTSDEGLQYLAARLGSDVPFFLHGGCALGRGRGDVLEPLPVPDGHWFVVAVPDVVIPNKTATLYSRLGTKDFSDGEQIMDQAQRLARGLPIDPALLGNAFARPLYELAPEIAVYPAIMRKAGADNVAISGAGPSHYAPFTSKAQAAAVADRLRGTLTNSARVFLVRPSAERPSPSRPL